MKERTFKTIEEVIQVLNSYRGKAFIDIDKFGSLKNSNNKGALGHIVEESILGYKKNSDKNADILVGDERYEIKLTPLKINKNKTISAKERLSMDLIQFMKIPLENFEDSVFWNKAKKLIIVYYFNEEGKDRSEFKIDRAFHYEYPEKDLEIIKNDWEFIRAKISSGNADLMSEGDTDYLGAMRKGQGGDKDLTEAPSKISGETILANRRAFSLKQGYMTTVARKIFGEKIESLNTNNISEYLNKKFAKYVNKTLEEIANDINFEIPKNPKNIKQLIMSKVLGISRSNLNSIEEFEKANIMAKTVTLSKGKKPPEQNMSFEFIDFEFWSNEDDNFYESYIYKFFEETKFLSLVFENVSDTKNQLKHIFVGFVIWNLPESEIETKIKPVWEKVRYLINDVGHVTYGKNAKGPDSDKLPGTTFNHVFHIRPGGRDSNDLVELPTGQSIPKQKFWLDRKYIYQQILNSGILEENQ